MATSKAAKAADRAEAVAELRKLLKPGATVYGIVRHVAPSGMSRDIDLYIFPKGEPRCLTGLASRALGWPMARSRWGRGLHVGGAGMDMVFHTISTLSRVLWPDGVTVRGEHRRADYVLRSESL